LRAATIDFRLTGANGPVRDLLRTEGPAIDILDEFARADRNGAPRQEVQHVQN